MQAPFEVESMGKKVSQVVDKDEKITAPTRIPKSHVSPPIEAKRLGTQPPAPINDSLSTSYFEVGHLFSSHAPPLTSFFV